MTTQCGLWLAGAQRGTAPTLPLVCGYPESIQLLPTVGAPERRVRALAPQSCALSVEPDQDAGEPTDAGAWFRLTAHASAPAAHTVAFRVDGCDDHALVMRVEVTPSELCDGAGRGPRLVLVAPLARALSPAGAADELSAAMVGAWPAGSNVENAEVSALEAVALRLEVHDVPDTGTYSPPAARVRLVSRHGEPRCEQTRPAGPQTFRCTLTREHCRASFGVVGGFGGRAQLLALTDPQWSKVGLPKPRVVLPSGYAPVGPAGFVAPRVLRATSIYVTPSRAQAR